MAKRDLTDQDRRLWKRVAASTTPLSGKKPVITTQEDMARLLDGVTAARPKIPVVRNAARIFQQASKQSSEQIKKGSIKTLDTHPIDRPVIQKISKGRKPIDARLDLHGLTQEHAKSVLYNFLISAQRLDNRIILVITGKGRLGSGVLRQMVPIWLTLPQFLPLVNGYQNSEPHHGGEGALYVRVRRLRDRSRP